MDDQMNFLRDLVPIHEEGVKITAQSSKQPATEEKAAALYTTARSRLLDINNWFHLNDEIFARFTLIDPDGKVQDEPAIGYYIRIEIPGPGNAAGAGYDWVKIEEIKDHTDTTARSTGIRVRPAAPPGATDDQVAHFYDDQSTSTFIVYHFGALVKAIIFDRNTKINTKGDSLIDKARNMIVGAGAITAFSKIQWKFLTEGFLQ